VDINSNKTIAERLLEQKKNNSNTSRSESLMRKTASNPIPEISSRMVQGVSDERREMLEMQVESGEFREQGSGYIHGTSRETSIKMTNTQAGVLSHSSSGKYKTASNTGSVTSGSSAGWRGSNDTVRQMGEIYSPLWLNSNLSLPRDRATINAWSRAFFALNPIVHNAITLHSTYPIAKLSIKSKNPKVEKFFSQMIEEIDLMNVCCQLAQEYWVLGEAFIYGELDEAKGRWSSLTVLNPDYVNVQRTVSAAEPIISLRPDENLKRVVFGNKPTDLVQRQQLKPDVIEHVRRNENIPLNNFYVSHLARKISPYEIRGTGLITSCFRQLMLFDRLRESKFSQADSMINPTTLIKIGNQDFRPTPVDLENWRNVFECYDEETEVLTNQGFRKFADVINTGEFLGDSKYKSSPIDGLSIACFNSATESIEYHEPSASSVYDYSGEMIKFSGRNMDIKVTPNHDMWVKNSYHQTWSKVKAEKLLKQTAHRTRAIANYSNENKPEYFEILGKKVPAELYMKFIGYLISEGSIEHREYSYGDVNDLCIVQSTASDCVEDIRQTVNEFASFLGLNVTEKIVEQPDDVFLTKPPDVAVFHIYNKKLTLFFKDQFSTNGLIDSKNKQIPRHILDLDPSLLKIMLNTLVLGDGSHVKNRSSNAFRYYTSSEKLANNVQEIVFKCGYSSNFIPRERIQKSKGKKTFGQEYLSTEYMISWSEAADGKFPATTGRVQKEQYEGKVYCFTVPTGLFVTRRNGKITIQGNSAENDKNFKIFTHDAVTVERIGWGQGIYDTGPDITQLIKEIYIGLMVPSVIMDGSDTTYATGSVALDVLRQRYMQFRQLLSSWLKNKIFAPISQINDFYEYVDGEKTLIVPDIDWNHMSLFDMDSFINNMVNLSQGEGAAKRVSLQTLYRSLGLEYEEEQRKIRYEDIQDAIRMKEVAAIQRYSIHELKSLRPGDEIEEVNEPVPGESPFVPGETGDSGGGMGGGGSSGGGGLGPMPGSPPSAPMGGGSSKPAAPKPAAKPPAA
jgi:hypothetical protein